MCACRVIRWVCSCRDLSTQRGGASRKPFLACLESNKERGLTTNQEVLIGDQDPVIPSETDDRAPSSDIEDSVEDAASCRVGVGCYLERVGI